MWFLRKHPDPFGIRCVSATWKVFDVMRAVAAVLDESVEGAGKNW